MVDLKRRISLDGLDSIPLASTRRGLGNVKKARVILETDGGEVVFTSCMITNLVVEMDVRQFGPEQRLLRIECIADVDLQLW